MDRTPTSNADFLEWIWTAEAIRTNTNLTGSMRATGAAALQRYREIDPDFVAEAIDRMPVECPVCHTRPLMLWRSTEHAWCISGCCVTPELWESTKLALARRWNEAVAKATPDQIGHADECDPLAGFDGERLHRHRITDDILHGRKRDDVMGRLRR